LRLFHLGRGTDRSLIGQGRQDWEHPIEEASDGCPGGDQVGGLVVSLWRFYRPATEGGGRVKNLALERYGDDLVVEAILYVELHESRRDAMRHKEEWDEQERQRPNGS
jgi:hypothetical protein